MTPEARAEKLWNEVSEGLKYTAGPDPLEDRHLEITMAQLVAVIRAAEREWLKP